MRPVLLALARAALGALFLYAAATKLPDMAAFATDLANYRMLPAALVPAAAAAVVGIELAVGALLVLGIAARAAALVTAAMLVFFVAGLSQALLRGIDLHCGCFGGAEAATWGTVLRDLPMLAAAVAVAVGGPGRLRPARAPVEPG
ncbi:MauE/DoxX family redox-associated membrane protein [Anaeromyxobacter paludicola]|uniref:Methylamine utilisation protein MauE domain-containing protein n=1 Tax=Anaeromyxobacter paludicola TaxID=2918171 RepID=A0ABN6N1J8_9BACT|nr:MauE/DoxX family redox-associated membrane protein [Anaeromyxobacter paludicola]BDG07104.1 hypothetical protein AMPC_02170 [Anaeromyxobacter paludicola]